MAWNSKPSRLEAMSNTQKAIWDGNLKGRIRQARPVVRGPLVSDPLEGDGDDAVPINFYQDTFTIGRLGSQKFSLSFTPIENSEHLYWNGVYQAASDWSRITDSSDILIPNYEGFLEIGDVITVEYAYIDGPNPAVANPTVIGCVGGVFVDVLNTTFDPAGGGAQAGDFLVLAIRGNVAPGGGDLIYGATCTDSRMNMIHTAALPVVEVIWAGFHDGSSSLINVHTIQNPSYNASLQGVLQIVRGVNGIGGVAATDASFVDAGPFPTPQVYGQGAVAVTWTGNSSFIVLQASVPTGYTDTTCSTGRNYGSTSFGFYSSPSASTSIAGTFLGEGCCVIGLV